MKRLRKILITLFVLTGLSLLWYWADKKDYFKSDYRDLTASQKAIFEWQDDDDGEKLMQRYRQHFQDSQFFLPP